MYHAKLSTEADANNSGNMAPDLMEISHVHNPILTAPDVLGETNEQSQSRQLICCTSLLKENFYASSNAFTLLCELSWPLSQRPTCFGALLLQAEKAGKALVQPVASRKRRLEAPVTGRKPNARTCLLLHASGRYHAEPKATEDLKAASRGMSRAATLTDPESDSFGYQPSATSVHTLLMYMCNSTAQGVRSQEHIASLDMLGDSQTISCSMACITVV